MLAKDSFAAKPTMPSDRELVIMRVFDGPRRLVFEALTKPEHVRRWYGPRRLTMTLCEIDLRPGGRWRYVLRDADGNEHAFSGVYREIVPPERIVSTEGYEALPGHDYLATVTLTERDGKTTLRSHLLYESVEDRDGHLQSGMEPGMNETFDRLNELLQTMA
jgi:uncharacterized protein YndB with AHSA1/START domain